jgi:putative hydrolase of the HAD superfamily
MSRLTGIRVVSFDADGTLWDFRRVMRQSLGHALRELERLKPRVAGILDIDRMIEIRDGVAEGLRGEVSDLETIRLEAFRQTLREVGIQDDALAEHLTTVYLKHRFGDIEPYDDVLPTLTVLGKRFKLGVISNGNSHPERCGLKNIFQFVVLSQDHGVEKPDERIFKIALEEAGCTRLELLHVGDSLENDVGGAIDSGMRGVWLNRDRLLNDTDIRPDREISSITKLLEIL